MNNSWNKIIENIKNNVSTCYKIEVGPTSSGSVLFAVYQKTDKTQFVTTIGIDKVDDDYFDRHIVEEWVRPYKYRITLRLSASSKDLVLGLDKIVELEQLISLILPKFYDNQVIMTVKATMKANTAGVRLITLEDSDGYRANIYQRTVMIAMQIGLLRIINAKLAVSKRALSGETIKFTDTNVLDYNKLLREQNVTCVNQSNCIKPSKEWQNKTMY